MIFQSKQEQKNKVDKGLQAQQAKPYITSLLEQFKKEIYNKLSTAEADTILLQGQAIMLRKIESELEKDINHGISAKKSLSKK